MKGRIETDDLREIGPGPADVFNQGDLVRQMIRCELDHLLQPDQQRVVDRARCAHVGPAVYQPMGHHSQRMLLHRFRNAREHLLERRAVIRYRDRPTR